MEIIGSGKRTYLWCGDESVNVYLGALGGEKTLRLLAESILAALDGELPG